MPDEPPIRVKNGSMTITLASSEWKPFGPAWMPRDGTNGGGFIVVVEVKSGSRRTLGQPVFGRQVQVSYSDGKVITFKSGTRPGRTKVTPKNALQPIAKQVLEYGEPGKGYITGVEVKVPGTSWSSTFRSRAELSEIDIYPLPNALAAKWAHARRKRQPRRHPRK